jgi:hypothetical protein
MRVLYPSGLLREKIYNVLMLFLDFLVVHLSPAYIIDVHGRLTSDLPLHPSMHCINRYS